MTSTYILCDIIHVFDYGQEPYPVIPLEIDKYTQIILHHAILPDCLAIYL